MMTGGEPLIEEIRRAEQLLSEYAEFYHAHEDECPARFRLVMLMNGWHTPFVALNELLKVICKNEMILKREGKKKGYKSRYREMRNLVQRHANER